MPEPVQLRPVPAGDEPVLVCALRSCGRPLPPQDRGRPRQFCADRDCQARARRLRDAAARRVRDAYDVLRQVQPGPAPVLDADAARAAAEAVAALRSRADALDAGADAPGWASVGAGSARRAAERLAAHLPSWP